MRWRRLAKGMFAVAGVGCAVAIYALTRERPITGARPDAAPLTPGTSLHSKEGVSQRYRLDILIAEILHHGEEVFADGRVLWKIATMTFKEDGTVISADTIESKGKSGAKGLPAELVLHGHVKLVGRDGESAEADDATYNESTGVLVVPGDVRFSRGKMTGSGRGATYTRDTGVFIVQQDAHVIMQPADASGPVDARARTLTFNRASRSMLFEGQAVITRADETMSADNATLHLADNDESFRVIELRTNARVMAAPGKVSSVPDMTARNIDLAFYPGTQMLQQGHLTGGSRMLQTDENGVRSIAAPTIDFGTAPDGKTLTRMDAREPVEVRLPESKGVPERKVTARSLVAQGDDTKGLTRALFEGNARFEEAVPAAAGQPARTRVGEGATLSLALAGRLDSIEEATFHQNVKFVDGDVTGVGDIGIYYANRDELWLQPLAKNAKRLPNVVSKDTTIDASDLIKVFLNTDNLYAKRDVKTIMKNTDKPDASRAGSTLFDPSKEVRGFGDEFTYDSAKKTARFVGLKGKPALLRQDDKDDATEVYGNELVLFKDSRDLTATGAVHSLFSVLDDGGPATKSATPPTRRRYDITADAMTYKDEERKAIYTGAPAKLKAGADGDIDAAKIELLMAAGSRTLERLEATADPKKKDDKFFAKLEGGREASGTVLIYDAASGRYTLRGSPLKLKSRESDGTCSVSEGKEAFFTKIGGDPQFPMESNPGGSSSKKIDCSVSIR